MLLKIIADDPQAAGAKQVLLHQLPCRLSVGAQANAKEGEVASRCKEVTALEEAGLINLANHIQT